MRFLLIIHSNSILSTINRKNTVGNDSILYIKKKIDALSSVRGKINTNYQHFTIQLIDKNGKIVAESSNKGSFEFTHVKPDTYTLRVLIDENGDGLFEKGSYLEKIRPEKIFFHPSPILLKANWEITDLILTF